MYKTAIVIILGNFHDHLKVKFPGNFTKIEKSFLKKYHNKLPSLENFMFIILIYTQDMDTPAKWYCYSYVIWELVIIVWTISIFSFDLYCQP